MTTGPCAANGNSVRNSVIGSLNLAVLTTNGGFRDCDAARLSDWPGRSICCMSESRDFTPAALGSKRPIEIQSLRIPEAPRQRSFVRRGFLIETSGMDRLPAVRLSEAGL